MLPMVYGQRECNGASGVPMDMRLIDDFFRDPSLVRRYKAALLTGFLFPDESRRRLMGEFAAAGVKTMVQPAQGISSVGLNDFARSAGAFVAAEPGVMEVDMSGDFLSVHALIPGTHRVRLPFKARVVNVKSGEDEETSGGELVLTMSAGETCWFRIYRAVTQGAPA